MTTPTLWLLAATLGAGVPPEAAINRNVPPMLLPAGVLTEDSP